LTGKGERCPQGIVWLLLGAVFDVPFTVCLSRKDLYVAWLSGTERFLHEIQRGKAVSDSVRENAW
jgi:hypothetical protein